MNNHEVAILAKMNELAERLDIHPMDITASIGGVMGNATQRKLSVTVDAPSKGANRLIELLGGEGREATIIDTDYRPIYEKVCDATERTPRPLAYRV